MMKRAFLPVMLAIFFSVSQADAKPASFTPEPPAGVSGQDLKNKNNSAQNNIDALNAAHNPSSSSADEKAAVMALPDFTIFDNTSASEQGRGAYMEVKLCDCRIEVRRQNGNRTEVWRYDLHSDVIEHVVVTPSGREVEFIQPSDKAYARAIHHMQTQAVSHLLHDKIITTPLSRQRLETVQDFLDARYAETK